MATRDTASRLILPARYFNTLILLARVAHNIYACFKCVSGRRGYCVSRIFIYKYYSARSIGGRHEMPTTRVGCVAPSEITVHRVCGTTTGCVYGME